MTTLIGNSVYDGEGDVNFRNVPDTLYTVVNRINEFLQANPFMPEIRNPVLPGETFTRHWDQNKYRHFREMFKVYTGKINDAYNEPDGQKSVKKWQDLFGESFGRSGGSSTVTKSAPAAGLTTSREVTPRKPYAR